MRAWAPGRVNLIGEHTDYSGGLVLPVAIQHGISIEAEVADGIELVSDRFGPASGAWGRYVDAVAAELAALGRPPVGIAGTVSSDLPPGAGLSSSAALEVAVALALCAAAGFELEPLELALACQRAELRAVGVPCGILDQAASVLGRANAAVLLDCATLEHRYAPVPEAAGLVVLDSGVERSLEGTGYGDRRRELESALARVGAARSTEVAPADLERLDGVELRRLRHVVTENARVEAFAAALAADDLAGAGALLSASHASLRDDYEVSIPELDLLAALAVDAGAHGARLLGGGFGGSVLALADAGRAEEVGRAAGEAYRAHSGRGGGFLVARASAGASVS